MKNKSHTQNVDHFGTQEGVPSWVVLLLLVFIGFPAKKLFPLFRSSKKVINEKEAKN